jgi:nucleoside-diphosphate-sugar epimerase
MALTLVTGGSGYVGAPAVRALQESGRRVRVLDSLLHGQQQVAAEQRAADVEVIEGDIRDPEARRASLEGVDEVIHLAAIVGDPACAGDPETSAEVNVGATRSLLEDVRAAGVRRMVFASTCSNYGRMADPTIPVDEQAVLAPVSLYAEQKVQMEQMIMGASENGLTTTCLRFATVYGKAPRMRFDLTVNEFTRDLWAGRDLEVYGEQFWRPYVHVEDAARSALTVLDAPAETVAGEVFNVGRSSENFRKLDLVEEIRRQTPRGSVSYVRRDEDPRDYKVSFEKIHAVLGFETTRTTRDGIAEILAALDANAFGDPYEPRFRNIA